MKKKIEEIVYLNSLGHEIHKNLVAQLNQLFEEEMLEIIGEDQEEILQYPTDLLAKVRNRNQLRQELREKLKHE